MRAAARARSFRFFLVALILVCAGGGAQRAAAQNLPENSSVDTNYNNIAMPSSDPGLHSRRPDQVRRLARCTVPLILNLLGACSIAAFLFLHIFIIYPGIRYVSWTQLYPHPHSFLGSARRRPS